MDLTELMVGVAFLVIFCAIALIICFFWRVLSKFLFNRVTERWEYPVVVVVFFLMMFLTGK